MPIVNARHQHGKTRTDYRRGCRCEDCRAGEAKYQRERREAKKQAEAREAYLAAHPESHDTKGR